MSARVSAGGAAAAKGMDFQHRVAAWVAVHILAEKGASPPWSLPSGTSLEWLRCETEQPVDDLLVGASTGGLIFVQVKRTLSLERAPDSDLASTLEQFVRQFIIYRNRNGGKQPWDRPLDPDKDRLVLITSPRSSEPIRRHLLNVLHRVRDLPQTQSMESTATNEEERRALEVALIHIRESWREVLNEDPSEEDLRFLLSLIFVQELDVESGGVGEHEAKNLLRSVILRDPDQADLAWEKLINLCARYAAERSGADRVTLQRELLHSDFDLKTTRSYEDDVEELRKHSRRTLNALQHHAQIRVGSTTGRVSRACTEALKQAAEEGSVLVVGEPGAGKSGTLHDLVEALQQSRRDYVFLAVDRLAARSLGELRAELGLDHELPEVLKNWPGLQPAFLVIDALDAARGDAAGRMIRALIREIIESGGRWRVVAAIRKFDLRYGVEIQQMFEGEPPTNFKDHEFARIRHVNIPHFSDGELAQIASQAPELSELLNSAPGELRELLRIPFNLRLIAELLGAGVEPEELTPVRTQIELLERYWYHRVIHDDAQGDAREAVLREVCEGMVRAKQLRLDRSEVARVDTSAQLNDLLSAQVLVEWQLSPESRPDRYVLAFSHHVLFDYAVARLLLRGDSEKVVRRLADDPDLVMVIRPSLVLHFTYLWNVTPDRRDFWNLVFKVIQSQRIPEVGKIIGPAVAAELARTMEDLEALCAALEESNETRRHAAEQALRHLVGALLARASDEIRLIGPRAGPWCSLLERISRNLHTAVAYPVRTLLTTLCEHPEDLTPEQRIAAGQTARRLLEFAWSQTPRDAWLVAHALQGVCRTFESDSEASRALIQRCLEPSHLSQFGFEEMPWLAREVKRLISLDPDLVEEIYRAAFGHREESEEPTLIGPGRILPLISNRRQDYDMALYELAETFPEFFNATPENATRALIHVMEAYVAQRHSPAPGEGEEDSFYFNGYQAVIRTDYSHIWDEGSTYRSDEPLKMLDAFQKFLEELAARPDEREKLQTIVRAIVSENRLAVLWRRLLLVGARFPDTLGQEILPLAWALPILKSIDTTVPAGEYLKAVFPNLEHHSRAKVEQAILSIPDAVPDDRRRAAERTRDQLLGCLPLGAVVTDEARRRLEELIRVNAVPPNKPSVRFSEVWSKPYGEEEYLKDKGVPVEAEPNRKIRELERPVKEFADKHLNTVPSLEEVNAILPALRELHTALVRANTDGVHPKQADYAWRNLVAACARIARAEGLSCEQDPGAFVKKVLLEASRCPEPQPDPQSDAQFDESPSWGRATRTEAAQGLIVLARHAYCATSDVLKAIQRLSKDPVPAVRFQIVSNLNTLYRTAPDLMWELIEHICQEEQSRSVLQGLLTGPLGWLGGVEPDRIAGFVKVIFDRVTEGPGSARVRELCVRIFSGLYIWRDQALSRERVLEIVSNPATHAAEVHHVLTTLRGPLAYGPVDPPDPEADSVRQRALDLLQRLLHSTRESLQKLEACYSGTHFNNWSSDDQETAKSLWRLIDSIGSEIYFASGAYDAKDRATRGVSGEVSPQSRRFYEEAGTILDELTKVPIPRVTHHLLETLEYFIPVDPRGVFLRIHQVIMSAQKGGYQYESLAANLIVRLIERYLAEHRELLQQDVECRKALIEILDVFVDAGWPSARKLTYRLEEIFR